MSATAIRPVDPVMLTRGFAELTIEARDLGALERFYREVFCLRVLAREHEGGDRSLYVEDLEGNVVEVWDFFERGQGRRAGAAALVAGDAQQDDPSS
jgi:catechol 2,3-dioxygenase-like lactoylglutathione lyase family enzyme